MGFGGKRRFRRFIILVPAVGFAAFAAPAFAQGGGLAERASTSNTAPVSTCSIVNVGDKTSGALLQARCGQSKTMIGPADRYEITTNSKTGGAAVSLLLAGTPQVLMVYANDEGIPIIQDLTAALAKSIGRDPSRGLVGSEVDLSDFAEGEAITVTEKDPGVGRTGLSAQVALGPLRAARLMLPAK